MIDHAQIRARFAFFCHRAAERDRRLYAAWEARLIGRGGIAAVSAATGLACSTIRRGMQDLAATARLDPARQRRPGGGRKPSTAIRAVIDP